MEEWAWGNHLFMHTRFLKAFLWRTPPFIDKHLKTWELYSELEFPTRQGRPETTSFLRVLPKSLSSSSLESCWCCSQIISWLFWLFSSATFLTWQADQNTQSHHFWTFLIPMKHISILKMQLLKFYYEDCWVTHVPLKPPEILICSTCIYVSPYPQGKYCVVRG